ncbi:MAG: hypothetical protein AAGM22_24350 [Acidobacteriota bacterium]
MQNLTNKIRLFALAATMSLGMASLAPATANALGLAGAGDIICINVVEICFEKYDSNGNLIDTEWGRFHE